MNICKINNIRYKYESYWRSSENSKDADSNGNLFPFPKEMKYWYNKTFLLNKLLAVENFLLSNDKFNEYEPEKYKNCLICNKQNITTGIFTLNRIRWENGLFHYIDDHNIKPSTEFNDKIFSHKDKKSKTKEIARIVSKIKKENDISYIRLNRNQIFIMDALMIHGSFSKKYHSKKDDDNKYSEHAGLLDFNSLGLDKIIISGNTTRVSKDDDEIYFPEDMIEAYDYEYIFHTHPATPKLGGRAEWGVLYEFPSISDIFHFIHHHNKGRMQGSIVMAAEGLYNIRANDMSINKIKINEDDFYQKVKKSFNAIQNDAITKYGINFSNYEFRAKISHDIDFIKRFNKVLNKYNIQIDFYPRIKDKKGRWVVDSIYLPVRPVEIYTSVKSKMI